MEPQTQMMQEAPEEAGRGTDTVVAHLSLGEVVIPRSFLDDPDVMGMLQALFQQNGASLAEFTVGDPSNKINPETGYPEFFFKGLKKIFKVAAPLALSYFAPGLGTALGSALGAGATFAPIVGGAALGAGTSAITGGKPLQGAVLGGVGGAINSAASGGFNDTIVGRGISDVASAVGDTGIGRAVGDIVGSSAKPLQGPTITGAPVTGTAGGSGILGALSKVAPSVGGISSGSTGGGSTFNLAGTAANIFGGLNQEAALKKQQKQLLGANQQQLANIESFDPSGITADPGYQFQLQEGQKALDRQLAAAGATGSGRAIKAGTEYNQNYAAGGFKDYYSRWLQKTQMKNALYGNTGDVQAQKTGASAQNINQSLANILGSPVGQYGQQNLTLEQLRRLGMAV